MAELTHVACAECEYVFPDGDVAMMPSPHRPACPDCGSLARRAHVLAQVSIGHHASLQGVGYSGAKRNWFVKFVSGRLSLFRKTGRWHLVDRTLNKRNNTYDEEIRDRETGELVHECHEPLTEHQGHGSARERGCQES